MNQPNSVLDINVRANVCSVKYSPSVPHELAVGSADHNVMIFDTRKHAKPVTVLSGSVQTAEDHASWSRAVVVWMT